MGVASPGEDKQRLSLPRRGKAVPLVMPSDYVLYEPFVSSILLTFSRKCAAQGKRGRGRTGSMLYAFCNRTSMPVSADPWIF
jgi:hypothetical protein